MIHLTTTWLVLAAAAASADDGPRCEVSLNGEWEHQIVSDVDAPPAPSAWKPCRVPGYLNGTDYQRAWFRRRFTVPPEMRGQRVEVRFGGVKFHSRIFVNGTRVGGCFGGHEPFAVDVTAALRLDAPNELLVGCHDWTGVFAPGKVEFPEKAHWDAVRNAPRDKILSPIGGLFGMYGIWDEVALQAHPPVYVSDVFVQPSVRRGELVVDCTVANGTAGAADIELRVAVEDGSRDMLQLPPARVAVAAGQMATVTLRQSWKNAPLWSPSDPHLLHLRTELSSGDRLRTRFGFREFWVDGHRFYLNGAPINLLATSWWPPHDWMTRDAIRSRWQLVQRMGAVAFRTHTQPWPALHYDVADELGLLMIVEGAVWNDDETYRILDPVFWENYARHLRAMVDRDKNRPSVVMWSLENEFFGSRLNDASPAKRDLVRMGQLVKKRDPTRPIFYESDGDPGGVADAIGIHYPHEYPDFTCWPNEAAWLERPAQIPHMFLNGQKEFVWRKDKPLYIGEFLWIPSRDPSWHTVFFGDEAYRDYHRYRNLAKAESWKMQILGYRRLEVGGISPWTVIEGGPLDETNPLWQAHRYAYQPIAAYSLDYDRRFYAGDAVPRRIAVFHDIREPSALELSWTLSHKGQIIDRAVQATRLDPGAQQSLTALLHMPPVDQRSEVVWRLAISRSGREVFSDSRSLAVFPRICFPAIQTHVGLWDPAGATRRVFDGAGLRTTAVTDLQTIPAAADVLVIGAGALQASASETPVIGRTAPERAALTDFLQRGGRVLVLRQEAYPEGLFDVALTGQSATMAFPQRPDHPALRRVEPDDLKFWRGDHIVATRIPARSSTGGAVPIVVSGSAAGIDHTPLLERRIGRGCIVHSQLSLVEKFATEPAAARILTNLIEYLAGAKTNPRRTAVAGGSEAYRSYLRGLGLRFDEVPGKLDAAALAAHGLVLCRGEVSGPETLRPWVEAGGNLWLHRVPAATFDRVCREFQLDVVARPYAGSVTRAEGRQPLLATVAREDLYWLGKHVGIDWAETPRAAGMSDGVFARTLDDKQAVVYGMEDWQLEGGIVERRPPGVVFATVGSASQTIDFPAAGNYRIGVRARGTPCFGVYPVARITVDGQPCGEVSVTDRWETTGVAGEATKGKHRVSVAFINDASDPPREDRNLFVDKVLIVRDADDRCQSLTSPAALAVVRCGRGLVILDQLRWDTEEENARKAARLASSLLTEFGGDFAPRLGVTIQCARMTPQPGMPFFSNQGSQAHLACNGYVQTPIEVVTARRYTLELVAGGTPAQGVYPLVEVTVGGRPLGRIQLTSRGPRSYFLDVPLAAGRHELRLAFMNDLNAAGEDRNLILDQVRFY